MSAKSDYKTYIPQMYTDIEFTCRFVHFFSINARWPFKILPYWENWWHYWENWWHFCGHLRNV